MRVFLSEYLTCGALSGSKEAIESLAVEGAAMLRALAQDAAAIPDCQVDVTWDQALPPFGVANVIVHSVRSAAEELAVFQQLARNADATLVIAPEFDGILESRCRLVRKVGGQLVGSTTEAIDLCSDKLALAAHLERTGVPTIPTELCDFIELARRFADGNDLKFVVKPRFGAGSVDTFFIRSAWDVEAAREAFVVGGTSTDPIVQPFVAGETLSVAAIVESNAIEFFPICRQHIELSDRLHYVGGCVPVRTRCDEKVYDVTRRAMAAVPDLRGYIGVDLLLPSRQAAEQEPLVVEINPRLTSSYHGYRLLSNVNLAERMLSPGNAFEPITWRTTEVVFRANGETRVVTADSPW